MKFTDNISQFISRFTGRKKEHPQEVMRAFEMARINRVTNDWVSVARSINYDIRMGMQPLRARARDMANNDPYAKKFLRMVKKNVVGADGFILRNKSFDIVADKDKNGNVITKMVLDKFANTKIQNAWWYWNKKENHSITQDISGREFSALTIQTVAMDGEVFIKKLTGKKYGPYGFMLQAIPAEYCDEKLNKVLPNGNIIKMGIEFNSAGQRVNYWFHKSNLETELYSINPFGFDFDIVPANQVIHLFLKETFDQVRGITWFAPSAIRMRMLYGAEEAGLVKFRTGAMTTGVFTPGDSAGPQFKGYGKDSDNNVLLEFSPGEALVTPKGWSFQAFDPQFPSQTYEAYVKEILRGISSGLDVSSHTLSSDYTQINYTSSRTALLDERDGWKALQNWLIEHFLIDIFEAWLEMALISKSLNLPPEKYNKFNQPTFTGRRWTWVDPKVEVEANALAWSTYQKPLEQIAAENGLDIEELLDQIASEVQMLKDRDLPLPNAALLSALPPKLAEITQLPKTAENGNANGNGKTN